MDDGDSLSTVATNGTLEELESREEEEWVVGNGAALWRGNCEPVMEGSWLLISGSKEVLGVVSAAASPLGPAVGIEAAA